MVVVLRGVGWECLCLCGGRGRRSRWEGSLRAALGQTDREVTEIHDFSGGSQGEALGHRAPLLTSELFAEIKVEVRNSLW